MVHTSTNILFNDSKENKLFNDSKENELFNDPRENKLFNNSTENELFNDSRENDSRENDSIENESRENDSRENELFNDSKENNSIMVPLYLHRSVFFYDNIPIYTRGLHLGPSCLCYNITKNTGACLNYFLYQNRKLFSEFRWYMFVKRLYQ